MAQSVVASLQGHDYQARFFWIKATALRDDQRTDVVEVSYEADGPKAFDDVIVRYDPPRASTGPHRVSVDYHQVKFHVTYGGSFGYDALVDPAFVGAKTFSVLQRLQQAKETAPADAAFTLVTVDTFKDGDQIGEIFSANDNSLRLDKLFVDGGDRSRMGLVRKLWRDHLGLSTDAELRSVLTGLHIVAGSRSNSELRDEVNLRFQVVGLLCCHETAFKYDGAAKALKAAGRNSFTRAAFEQLCREEGWIREGDVQRLLNVSLRSFRDGANDDLDAHPENTLSLVHLFDERYLRPGADWTQGVQPQVTDFLVAMREKHKQIRLFLDVHSSIAFLAGAALSFKSGMLVELVQKGRQGPSVWRADDGKAGPTSVVATETISDGTDAALIVSLSRDASDDVREYVDQHLPSVGKVIHVTSGTGVGQAAVAGGAHAAAVADEVAEAVRKARLKFGATVHVFITAPNAFTFFLGQHREAIGPCVLYEFDFKRKVDGSYHPSFRIA